MDDEQVIFLNCLLLHSNSYAHIILFEARIVWN